MSEPSFSVIEPDTIQESRHRFIGASQAGAILGHSPYSDAHYELGLTLGVYAKEDKDYDPYIFQGTAMEKSVVDYFEHQTGMSCTHHGDDVELIHPDYPFIGAHLDFTVNDAHIVGEVKTSSKGSSWPGGNGEMIMTMPDHGYDHYYDQIQHLLLFPRFTSAFLVVWVFGQGMKWYQIFPNDKYQKAMIERYKWYWALKEAGTLPPPEIESSCRLAYGDKIQDKEAVVLANECDILTMRHRREIKDKLDILKAATKRWQAELDNTVPYFMNRLQDVQKMVTEDGKSVCSWSVDKNGNRVFRPNDRRNYDN